MTAKNEFKRSFIIRSCKLLHILLTAAAFFACCRLFYLRERSAMLGVVLLCYLVPLVFSLRTYHGYNLGMAKVSMMVFGQFLSELLAAAVVYVIFTLLKGEAPALLPLVGLLAVQTVINCLWSIAANRIYFTLYRPWKSAVVCRDIEEAKRLQKLFQIEKKFAIRTVLQTEDEATDYAVLADHEAVILIDVPQELRNSIMQTCVSSNVRCYVTPTVGDILMRGGDHLELFSVPVFRVIRSSPNAEYVVIKRAMDIVCSLLAIVILSPVMALTALAIRAYDKGPALYRQTRLTKDGKTFEILKFRSMRVDAESDGVARLATEGDNRITPVGRLIRSCRLDELPQLFNILRGDMSIVGPRPERPEIAAQYAQTLPTFDLRLQVKAGLTGFAQVYGRYNTQPQDKLLMDLMYINRMSLLEDFKLILATVRILFLKESTQGTEQGQTTAMTGKKDQAAV